MNEQLRQVLAEYLANQPTAAGGDGQFAPPPQPGGAGPNLPRLSVQSRGPGLPGVGAEYSMPAAGGDLTLRGDLSRPDAQTPVNWGAMLGYNKQF